MLRGERVILRPPAREDIKRLSEATRRPEHVEAMMLANGAWEPAPDEAYEKEFEGFVNAEEKSEFVIECDGKPIGFIGLTDRNRRAGTAALGVNILDVDYLGKGYGRDAIDVFLGWAFRIQNYRRIGLEVLAVNERAVRAYRACGFVVEGRKRRNDYYNGEYVDTLVMGLLRSEWEATRR